MSYIADLHIHSAYSRATSKDCLPEYLDLWARRKGITLVGTGDFTHPAWRQQLAEKLQPAEEGLYVLKNDYRLDGATDAEIYGVSGPTAFDAAACRPRFILSAEISSIYKKNGKVRKVHNLILLPGLAEAEKLSQRLEQIGNLHSDGRPILGLDSRDLLEITLEICPRALFVPAHIWTPHFSLFGAYSGFDRIEDCFEDLTPHIYALETGLSSDPPMNWRVSALDRFTLISNSDAHSPSRLGREANLLEGELSYSGLYRAISRPADGNFLGTLEFFPQEGKYHMDGHRRCQVCLSPQETLALNGVCPVCGRKIVVGVLHRTEELADRPAGYRPPLARDFQSLIPLPEVIAATLGVGAASKKCQSLYHRLLAHFGSEFSILRDIPIDILSQEANPCLAQAIRRLRRGEIHWAPGYDGEYGKATLLTPEEISDYSGQIRFFAGMDFSAGPSVPKPRKTIAAAKPLPSPEETAAPPEDPHHGLNAQQWAAVSAPQRETAVIAGPGAGKTRTLIQHILYLITEQNVPPQEITAVTFTNKAAAEIRQRLAQQLPNKRLAAKVHVGTFHSICLDLLSQWRGDVPLLDDALCLSLAAEAGRELSLSQSPRELARIISNGKNAAAPPEDGSPRQQLIRLYQQKLQAYPGLDFDDLLLETLNQFTAALQAQPSSDAPPSAVRPRDWRRFRYLLADEFQDINPLQYRLLLAWGAKSDKLFVIGDPHQAIYGFRGANAHCFDDFLAGFPHCAAVTLDQNYRSTPEILTCASALLAGGSPAGNVPRIRPCRPGNGHRVQHIIAPSPFAEALYVAKAINRLVGGIDMLDAGSQDTPAANGFADIAVLYRTHRQAAVLEECLQKEGIPYTVSGKAPFLQDAQVQAALSFFRHLLRPRDPAAAKQAGRLLAGEDLSALERRFEQTAIAKEKPWKLLDQWMAVYPSAQTPAVLDLRNTALLHKTMPDFLSNITLGEDGDIRRSGGKTYRADSVSLSTLHAAKGLEFPVVFLCGVSQDTLPYRGFQGPADEAEERRLFYVGMTRAREQLILLTPGEPSPFLRDIPESLLEKETVSLKTPPSARQLSLF
ncbi:MAG: UvrD-helicase domain-containing protein [Firmicutes bacterium]|nr:UvrD-helicase domain-containing protein [Bacillota bacterium]